MTSAIEAQFERYGPVYKWLATITVMMGTISMVLTTTIINVAIPDIMGAFGISQDQAQWLSTGFLAAMTATMLLNAWAISAFGQRNTYVGALVIFIFASIMGGLSPNHSVLIISRVLQGAMAGLIQPLAMLTIFQVFRPEERGSAMGIYGIGVVLAPALGPTLGGLLVDNFDWRAVFFVALPFCIIGIFLAPFFMIPKESKKQPISLDWSGFLLLSLFLVFLLYGLSNGQRLGWDHANVQSSLLLSIIFGLSFMWRETHTSDPLLDVRIFTIRRFAAGSGVAFIYGAGLFGSTYLLPLFVQNIQGFTPTASGILLMPAGLALGLIFPLAGRLSDRLSPDMLIIPGLVFFSYSCFLLAHGDVNTPFWTMAMWIVMGRVGLGLVLPPLNARSVASLPPEWFAQGAGAINFMRQLGGAFGVNLLSIILDRRTFFHNEWLAQTQTHASSITLETLNQLRTIFAHAGVAENLQVPAAYHFLAKMVASQGGTRGFQDGFLIVAFLFLSAIIPARIMGSSARG